MLEMLAEATPSAESQASEVRPGQACDALSHPPGLGTTESDAGNVKRPGRGAVGRQKRGGESMENEVLFQRAIKAIREVFNDTSVDQQKTACLLAALCDEIDLLLEALEL